MSEQGKIVDVTIEPVGTNLEGDHASGVSTLQVSDAGEFDETGGSLVILGVTYGYTAANPDTDVITLSAPMPVALDDQETVYLYPQATSKWALVKPEGQAYTFRARIPHTYEDALPDGIREEWDQESCVIEIDPETEDWTIVDIIGRTLDRDGTYVDLTNNPLIPFPPDGRPPAAMGAVATLPAVHNIFLKWAPILLNDLGAIQHQVVTYKVYVSDTPGVPTDSAHLVGQTNGTMASVTALGDGTRLQQFTDSTMTTEKVYYFKVTAEDEDGVGTASPEVSDSLDQNGTDDIAVGSITAAMLQSILILGTTITTRAQDPSDPSGQTLIGPGITLTPTSLIAYDTTGRKTLEVTPNSAPAAVFRGDAEIDHLTVLTLTTLQTSLLSQGAIMTLQNSVANPANAPSATVDNQTDGFTADGAWTGRYGWAISPSGNYAFTTWKDTGSGVWRIERWNLTTKTRTHSNLISGYLTITGANKLETVVYADSDTTCWLIVQKDPAAGGASNKWHLIKVDATTVNPVPSNDYNFGAGVAGTVATDYTAQPAATFDGTNWVIWWQTSAFHLVYQYGTPSGSNLANVGSSIDTGVITSAAADLSSVNLTSADFGAQRFVVTYRNSVSSPYATCMVFNTSGVRQTNEEWIRNSTLNYSIGSWWDATASKWKTMQQGSVVTYESGGNWWTTSSGTWWIAYAWTNGATTSALEPTTAVYGVGMTKRGRLNVTTPQLPPGVTGVDIYLARGASAPATTGINYKRQGAADVTDPNQPKLTITSANWSAADNPTASGFGSGSPAKVQSEVTDTDGAINDIEGNGSARIGAHRTGTNGLSIRHRFRVSRKVTAMLQATAGTQTTIAWDTLDENNSGVSGAVVLASGTVTIQRTGWYLLQFTGNWQGAAAGTSHGVAILVNAVVVVGDSTNASSSANIYMNANLSKKVFLSAGDVVRVDYVSTSANAGFEAAAGNSTTSITQLEVLEEV